MASSAGAKTRVGAAVRHARSAVAGSAVVLAYHRVIELESDASTLAVMPELFEQQAALLAAEYNVLHASELAELVRAHRRIPRRSVVLTFDDGYFDVLTGAKPILERHGLPATAFVSTAEIGTSDERWWDELEYLILGGHELPERIELGAGGAAFSAPGGAAADARDELFARLAAYLRPLGAPARSAALDELASAIGTARPRRPEYRTLDEAELAELAAGGLVQVGAHTASHRLLAAADAAEQAHEIGASKSRLEGILGAPVTLFCYPHGGRDAIDASAMRLVREAGFSAGFANWFGLVFPWSDRYALPRCTPVNEGAEAMHRRLEHWFALGR